MNRFKGPASNKEQKIYKFELVNGTVIPIEAEDVIEAVQKFKEGFPNVSWTIRHE